MVTAALKKVREETMTKSFDEKMAQERSTCLGDIIHGSFSTPTAPYAIFQMTVCETLQNNKRRSIEQLNVVALFGTLLIFIKTIINFWGNSSRRFRLQIQSSFQIKLVLYVVQKILINMAEGNLGL